MGGLDNSIDSAIIQCNNYCMSENTCVPRHSCLSLLAYFIASCFILLKHHPFIDFMISPQWARPKSEQQFAAGTVWSILCRTRWLNTSIKRSSICSSREVSSIHSVIKDMQILTALVNLYQQDWKAVQRCASKTDHLPIWINTKYTIQNLRYWITKLDQVGSSGINWDKYFLAIWNKYINTFLNIRQIHLAIWDNYILQFETNACLQFETNTFPNLRQIYFAI